MVPVSFSLRLLRVVRYLSLALWKTYALTRFFRLVT